MKRLSGITRALEPGSSRNTDTAPSSKPELDNLTRPKIIVTLQIKNDLKAVEDGTAPHDLLHSLELHGPFASATHASKTQVLVGALKDNFNKCHSLLTDAWRSPLLDKHRETIAQCSKDSEEFRMACEQVQKHLCHTVVQASREQLRYYMDQVPALSLGTDEIPLVLADHTAFPSEVGVIATLGRDVLDRAFCGELTLLQNLRPLDIDDSATRGSKSRLRLRPTWGDEGEYLSNLTLEQVPEHLIGENSLSALRSLQHLVWHARTPGTSINARLESLAKASLIAWSESVQQDFVAMVRNLEIDASKYLNETLKSWEAQDPSSQRLTDFVEVLGRDV